MARVAFGGIPGFRYVLSASIVVLVAVLPGSVSAAPSCIPVARRVSPLEMEWFAQDPVAVLSAVHGDPERLRSRIINYVATDSAVVSKMDQLVHRSTGGQRRAIGAGLLVATHLCSTLPAARDQIEKYVRKIADDAVRTGFAGDYGSPFSPSLSTSPSKPANTGNINTMTLWGGEFGSDLRDPFSPITSSP